MNRDDIEIILKQSGWKKTTSAPERVVDYKRHEPHNRIILYPEDFKYMTEKYLREYMAETNVSNHGEILLRAKQEYETSQKKLVPSIEEKVKVEGEKLRAQLKLLIDRIPASKLVDFATFIEEFVSDKTDVIKGIPEIGESKVAEIGGSDIIVVRGANEQEAKDVEIVFNEIKDGVTEYKSAVVIEPATSVRVMMRKLSSKLGAVPIHLDLMMKEDAEDVVFLMDGALNKSITIDKVERSELIVAISYTRTGFKEDWFKTKRKAKFRYIMTNQGLTLVDLNNKPVFEEKRSAKSEEGGDGEIVRITPTR